MFLFIRESFWKFAFVFEIVGAVIAKAEIDRQEISAGTLQLEFLRTETGLMNLP